MRKNIGWHWGLCCLPWRYWWFTDAWQGTILWEFLLPKEFWPLYYGNTNEQSKVLQREPALLIIIFYLSQNSHHNLLPQTRIQSWVWQESTKESPVYWPTVCWNCFLFRKFHSGILSLKWSSKYLSIMLRIRMKAADIIDGQYNRQF